MFMFVTKKDLNRRDISEKEKVEYICENCGKVRKQYFFSLKEKPGNFKKCNYCITAEKTKETCFKKYGVENPR